MTSYIKYTKTVETYGVDLNNNTNFRIVCLKNEKHKEEVIKENKIVCVYKYVNWTPLCATIQEVTELNNFLDKFPLFIFATEKYSIDTNFIGIPSFCIYINGNLYRNLNGIDFKEIENILLTLYNKDISQL